MKLLTGTRIGQSHRELAAAVLFSFLLHLILAFAAVLLTLQVRQRVQVPPLYSVKLVGPPADMTLPPTASPSPGLQPPVTPKPPEPKPARKAKAGPKQKPAPAAVKKGAMPELDAEKPKEQKAGEEAGAPKAAAGKQEAVAVASSSQEFQFPPYVAIVRDKVERNWNPPPGAKGAKATVLFTILRSGRVGDSKLQESSGNFYFDQAAMRAILASSPFPPLPEGFFRESETFSVDLMENE